MVDPQNPIQRDWRLSVKIPPDHMDRVVASCLGGTLDIAIRGEHTNVLLCALPKSGSLYLTQLLALSLGLTNHQVGFDQRGGALYYPRMLAAKYVGGSTISHCHATADGDTLKQILALGLRPVVLTRNLLDALVSRCDMLRGNRACGQMLSRVAIERFLAADEEQQLDTVIDLFAPYFINFAAGWAKPLDEKVRPIHVTYEAMLEDEVGLVGGVGEALGIEVDPERVRVASEAIRAQGGINFSKGIPGRGRRTLTPAQIERLDRLAATLGCADEEFLGFEPRVAA